MVVAREEIFGPVVSVITFETEDEAIRIANDTPYGLSGSLWTRDGARQLRVARALRTGAIGVNSNSSVFPQVPFGGYKASGVGKELGHGRPRAQHRAEERLRLDRALERGVARRIGDLGIVGRDVWSLVWSLRLDPGRLRRARASFFSCLRARRSRTARSRSSFAIVVCRFDATWCLLLSRRCDRPRPAAALRRRRRRSRCARRRRSCSDSAASRTRRSRSTARGSDASGSYRAAPR